MKRNYLTLGLLSLALAACGGGENGLDGKDGKDGAGCTITNNEDGTATISCPDGSSFTVKNGEKGHTGDAGSDGEKGQNGQSCKLVENADGSAAVVCPADGSSYIVRGNTDNYANYCAPGFYGKNCENECACQHGSCNDGVTGDGSCNCEMGYYGDNCVDCTKEAENSYFGKEECTYTDTRDANSEVIYPLVKIGDRLWMVKNMAYDDSGTDITCYTNTDEANNGSADFAKKYGCLYTWEDAQKVCPAGWHLPEYSEFETFVNDIKNGSNLSSIRASSWASGSNTSGFEALPAGRRLNEGNFKDKGITAYFWSDKSLNEFYSYNLIVSLDGMYVTYSSLHNALSVRCIKD